MKSPKISPQSRHPPQKNFVPIESPESGTLLQSVGGWGFRLSRLVASAGFAVRKMGWDRIKLVWGVLDGFMTAVDSTPVKYRAPPAPATLLFRQRRHEHSLVAFTHCMN
jgi:hypothetical protein